MAISLLKLHLSMLHLEGNFNNGRDCTDDTGINNILACSDKIVYYNNENKIY